MASATSDLATLKGAFEVANENGADGAEADTPRPCRMTLGDFKKLGDFLDEFSGYAPPGASGVSS
jgi:hypothetical protein